MTRKHGFMEIKVAREIARQAQQMGVRHIQLAFGGEPTLHHKFIEIIHIFKEHGCHVELFTNGHFIDRELSEHIITSRLDMLNFSVDGFSKEVYESIRIPSKFMKVHENIQSFFKIRKQYNVNHPYIRLYITPQKKNLAEIRNKKYQSVFGKFVDGYYFNAPNNWTGSVDTPPINNKDRMLDNNRCLYLWVMMVVAYNGDVVPCPCDYDTKYVLGNIRDQTLSEIWNGTGLKKLRKSMCNSHVPKPRMCQQCLWRVATSSYKLLSKRILTEMRMFNHLR
jgi:radical SAM protein with 4Fe4S-binding SPASM domain